MLYSIDWPNLIVWLPLLLEILSNAFIVNIGNTVCDIIYSEANVSYQAGFLHEHKSHDKSLSISRMKRAFNMK